MSHARLVAGFYADHREHGRADQKTDCVVDAIDHGRDWLAQRISSERSNGPAVERPGNSIM